MICKPSPTLRMLKPVFIVDADVEVAITPPRTWIRKAVTSQRTKTSAVIMQISKKIGTESRYKPTHKPRDNPESSDVTVLHWRNIKSDSALLCG